MYVLVRTVPLISEVVPLLQGALLFLNNGTSVNLANTEHMNTQLAVSSSLKQSSLLGFDFEQRLVFVLENNVLRKIPLNPASGNGTTIASSLRRIDALAYDWIGQNLYYACPVEYDGRIDVVNINTLHRKTLLKTKGWTNNIVVDPKERYLFWSDASGIHRSSMDGLGPVSTVSTGVYKTCRVIKSMTIDYSESRIFWSCSSVGIGGDYSAILSSDYDGDHINIVTELKMLPFVELDMKYDDLFVLVDNSKDWMSNNYTLFSIDKTTGDGRRDLAINMEESIKSMKIVSVVKQPSGSTPCSTNSGGCSHLCLLSKENQNNYACACPTGVKFVEGSNTKCEDGIHDILLFARRFHLMTVSLDTLDSIEEYFLSYEELTDRDFSSGIMDVDYDPIEKYVYWLDNKDLFMERTHRKDIVRAKIDGTAREDIITGVDDAFLLSVNKKDRKMYWMESDSSNADRITIKSIDLNGNSPKDILTIDTDREIVKDMEIHAEQGYLFWIDGTSVSNQRTIQRIDTDGSNRKTIVGSDLENPSALEIDEADDTLYWIDLTDQYKIERSNLDGSGRSVIIRTNLPYRHMHPCLSILGNSLVYTYETDTYSVEKKVIIVDKNTGEVIRNIDVDGDGPLYMKAIHLRFGSMNLALVSETNML